MHIKRSTLRAIEFDHHFWDHPERWPPNPPNYVFLARAFQEIGRAKYGEQWTDSYIEPKEPPEDCDDAADDQFDSDCEKRLVTFGEMRASTARTIAEQSELGNLVTAVRHTAGGQMNQLEPYLWNTENFGTRFFRCQMSLSQPFQDPARVHFEPLHWIYITRESLDRYICGGNAARSAANSPGTRQSKPKGRGGRRRGSGSYAAADNPLMEEMKSLIEDGRAKSAHDAAGKVVDKAQGSHTTPESKRTRLAKRYREKYDVGAK